MKCYVKIFSAMLAVTLLCSCSLVPPAGTTQTAPNTTLPAVTATPGASISATIAASPTPQSPSVTTDDPTATPAIIIPASPAPQAIASDAMQRDISLLISQSEQQQGNDTNYKNIGKKQKLVVESVTKSQIKFAGKTQVFKGNYTGQFTAKKSYIYFEDADMGGKRYYTLKDNFGVWITFKYVVPF